MKREKIDIKLRLPSEGLYLILIKRLESCKTNGQEIISFPKIFSKLSVSFQLKKKKVWELLYLFHDLGFIEIICGHGIKLNYKIDNKIK